MSADWNSDVTKGIPFGSVVSLVVRKGNPKNIEDWDDLLRPGVEVVTPSPLSSGSAKWNLLAPYAAKSDGGKNSQAGLDFVDKLVTEHVKTRPSSGREATDVFLQGTGDVLISLRERGDQHRAAGQAGTTHQPAADLQDREPGGGGDHQQAPEAGQRAEELPVHPGGTEALGRGGLPARRSRRWPPSSRKDFPAPQKLWTIADLGGWSGGRSGAVRQGQRRHHQDLQAGHWMTELSSRIRSDPARGRPEPGRRRLSGRGAPPLRVGAATMWLSRHRVAAAGRDRVAVGDGRLERVLAGGHLERGAGVVPGHADDLDRRDGGQRGVRPDRGLGADPRRRSRASGWSTR